VTRPPKKFARVRAQDMMFGGILIFVGMGGANVQKFSASGGIFNFG
jgi:hypothetical protein